MGGGLGHSQTRPNVLLPRPTTNAHEARRPSPVPSTSSVQPLSGLPAPPPPPTPQTQPNPTQPNPNPTTRYATHYMSMFYKCQSEGGRDMGEIASKVAITLLRYNSVLPVDKVFYLAGMYLKEMKQVGGRGGGGWLRPPNPSPHPLSTPPPHLLVSDDLFHRPLHSLLHARAHLLRGPAPAPPMPRRGRVLDPRARRGPGWGG